MQTYQVWFEWRLYFASQEVIPIYMTEEWVGLGNTMTAAGILLFYDLLLVNPFF